MKRRLGDSESFIYMPQSPVHCFTTVGSDKVEVRHDNEEADILQFKDQNMQTEIVQIKDQQVQAESTEQLQGIKTAAIAVWLCTILSVVSNSFV